MANEVLGTHDVSLVVNPETLLDTLREIQSELAVIALMLQESDRIRVNSTKIPEGASTGGGENACWV